MQVTVTFRNIEATDALRRYADAKVRRIAAKYFRRPVEGHVVLAVNKRRHTVELTVNAERMVLNAEGETGDLYSAIDAAVDKIERQTGNSARASRAEAQEIAEDEAAGTNDPTATPAVVETERVAAKPMSVEEAVMQLDVSANDFLVFRNASNETVNVLYRRKDGNYGLIQPDVRTR